MESNWTANWRKFFIIFFADNKGVKILSISVELCQKLFVYLKCSYNSYSVRIMFV